MLLCAAWEKVSTMYFQDSVCADWLTVAWPSQLKLTKSRELWSKNAIEPLHTLSLRRQFTWCFLGKETARII